MSSNTDICNNALYMLGSQSILALTDDTERARLCNGRYAEIRDMMLRSYPWNFAIKRATLARSATTPVWEYDYLYALPTNPYCLKALDVEECYKWKVEGRYIATDASTCNLVYIARITDPNEMDILFREAWSARLAADICYALTGSPQQQQTMLATAEQKIRTAKSVDAQEGYPESLTDDTFVDSRY